MADAPNAGATVLLVDNEPLIRAVLAEVLRRSEYNVRIADSGTEAIELVQRRTPALVMTDVQMPGLTGWDVLEQINRIAPTLPVLMMSGLDAAEQARERGAAGFIMKPYRPAEIIDAVRAALDAYRDAA